MREPGKKARVLLLEQGPRVGKKAARHRQRPLQPDQRAHFIRGVPRPFPVRFPRLFVLQVRAGARLFRTAGSALPHRRSRTDLPLQRAGVHSARPVAVLAPPRRGGMLRLLWVEKLRRTKTGFLDLLAGKALRCAAVILATGGRAAPSPGGGTEGYALLSPRSVTASRRFFPALAPVKSDPALTRALKGCAAAAPSPFWRTDGQ